MKIRLLLSCRVTSSACSARHASRADNQVFSVLCPDTMMQVDRAWPKYGVHPEGQQLRTPEIKNEKLDHIILQLKETQSEGSRVDTKFDVGESWIQLNRFRNA